MNLTIAIFLLFGALTMGAGVWLALTKNIIHAAFLFFMVLFGTAGLFVFAGAEFLAVSQIIIYVGGILIVLLFGVMLTHKLREAKPETRIINVFPGLLVSGLVLAGLVFMVIRFDSISTGSERTMELTLSKNIHQNITHHLQSPATEPVNDVETIGRQTITEYLLPFEVVSVLLLVALIGAAYISRKNKEVKDG